MYNQFFALRENPFNVNPDPRFLFLNSQAQHALDSLTRGIQARKGLLLFTGEVGTGKTTLLNHLLDWLHQQRTPTAFIFNSHLEVSDLFDFVLMDFAVKFDATSRGNSRMRLQQWLLESFRAGQTPVMIVDEAQGLADHVLEEIRMLLNMETCSEKLLQIVLAGQPELDDRLQQPALRQVKQRIALRCKTAPLSRDETHQYVQTRLHIAGASAESIFASQAIDAAHFYSRGIPRVTNLLCEHALINASVAQIRPVPASFVAEVAGEFQFDDDMALAPSRAVIDRTHSSAFCAQSRFLNALVSLSTTDQNEPPAAEPLGPEVIPGTRAQTAPDTFVSPVQDTAAPYLCRESPLSDPAGAVTAEPPSTRSPASAFSPDFEPDFASRSVEAVAIISAHAFTTPCRPSLAPAFKLAFEQAFTLPFEPAIAPALAAAFEPAIMPAFEPIDTTPSEQNPVTPSEQDRPTPAEVPAQPFDFQPAADLAPWQRQVEARLTAEWTSFFSEVGSSLASGPAGEATPEPPVPNHPPRLHLVEPKSALALSPAAIRRPMPGPQHAVLLASKVDGWKSSARSYVLTQLLAAGIILSAGASKATARFSSVARAATRSRIIAHLPQLPARFQSSARSLCWESLAGIDRCLNLAASIDWPQLWLTTSRWLRQPCDPTQWRLQHIRPFNELLRFNHKKMG